MPNIDPKRIALATEAREEVSAIIDKTKALSIIALELDHSELIAFSTVMTIFLTACFRSPNQLYECSKKLASLCKELSLMDYEVSILDTLEAAMESDK